MNNTEPHILTKEQYKLIFDGSVSIKQQKELIKAITDRVDWIIRRVAIVKWYDFINGNFFKSFSSSDDYAQLDGAYSLKYKHLRGVYNWFEVDWLFNDCIEKIKKVEEKYIKEVEDSKQKKQKQKEKKKAEKAEMKKRIREKLTEEELKFISFK